MTRFSSTPNTNAVSADHVEPVLFADLDFSSGHVRFNTSDKSLSIGGNSYQGTGGIVSIEGIKESAGGVPEGLTLTLAGVDNSIITTTLAEKYHNRSATIYIGWLSDGVLVDTPYLIWEGLMDKLTILTDVNVSTIRLDCESRLLKWNKANEWIYSDEHQKILMGSGDNFFDQLGVIQDQVFKWGDAIVTNDKGSRTPPREDPGSKYLP